jgi:broad specificity phosphatase PhoE
VKQLYFVRHGESVLNVERIFAGRIDTALTSLGEQQAKLAGAQAKQLQINLIVTSPQLRALKTAQIIAEDIGYPLNSIVSNPLFMERSLGSLEGKSWDEYNEDDSTDNNVESEEALLIRAKEGLEYLRQLGVDTVLLVSHGSFSRALRTAIDPTGEYEELANAELIQLI